MKPIITALFIGAATATAAAGVVDLGSRARMRSGNADNPAQAAMMQQKRLTPVVKANTVRGFVTLRPGYGVEELRQAGVQVENVRGNIALVSATADAVEAMEDMDAVARFTVERPILPKLDIARAVTGIDKIHAGQDLTRAYTGKGVVTGIVDGGFDPNHINFKNADGTSRVGLFTYFRPVQAGGFQQDQVTAENMDQIDTETDETFHGTHTLGILAGGYKGDVEHAVRQNAFASENVTAANPYYGVATDGDIAVSAGALTDYYIAMGCEAILNYAAYRKAPVVINLSLGSNVGPHDGTSTICQYIDEISAQDNAIVCISAGNEGDMPITLSKNFTDGDNVLRSCLYPAAQVQGLNNVRYGQTYFYSDSSTPFEIQAVVVNRTRGVVAMRMPMPATDGAIQYWVSDADYKQDDTDIVSAQFGKWFEGYIGVGATRDEVSGRYYAVLDCMCWDNTTSAANNPMGNYIIGFQITGAAGQRMDVYGDGGFNYFNGYGLDGFTDGQFNGTINDVACGKSPIVVGSYNTRDNFPAMDNGIYGYNNQFLPGKMSSFTSFGSLVDGRNLPTVCAPGATVVSSSNEYYLDAVRAGDESRQAAVTTNGRRHSWHQCIGTSMSSPLVAGSIALWLEADPTLTAERVRDIISRTAVKDDDTRTSGDPVQWGAGKFDAYAGIKEVIKGAGVGTVTVDAPDKTTVQYDGHCITATCPAGAVTVEVYNTSGAKVATATDADGRVEIPVASLGHGVYVVKANTVTTKITI